MSFPPSRSLPPLLHADDLKWRVPTEDLRFWTCMDATGARWLVKLRGGFYAVRERAFSVIAQALDISCQSSTFLKMPPRRQPWPVPANRSESTDVHQLAIRLLDEHSRSSHCPNCPLPELNTQFAKRPYDLDVLRQSRVTKLLDWARGEMLGMLCEMHEPPGRLLTTSHEFVQIDNELMFSRAAGADLRDSPGSPMTRTASGPVVWKRQFAFANRCSPCPTPRFRTPSEHRRDIDLECCGVCARRSGSSDLGQWTSWSGQR